MTKFDEIVMFIMTFISSAMILQIFHYFFSFDGACGLKRAENLILYIRKIVDDYFDGELKLTYKDTAFKIVIQSEDYDRYTKYQVFINDELAMSLHKLEKEITYARYYKIHNNRSTNEVWKILKACKKLCKETVRNHTEAKIKEPLYRSYFK
jgi:hypothetical protein